MTQSDPRPASEEALLAQMSWIRRLAHRLVVDQELAEDLVQETVVVALEQRPNDLSKLRRWLASVMRNVLRQHLRGSGRRRQREELTARREVLESTDALVERVSIQRELAEHVLALHEPYRSVVILRFFDELPPRDISRRLGVPLATVNSRLQRGLALLRRRLDSAHGARSGWMSAFLPLVERFELSPPSVLGGLVVNVKVVALVSLVVVAGAVAWTRRSTPASVASGPERAAESLSPWRPGGSESRGADDTAVHEPELENRRALAAPLAPAPSSTAAPAEISARTLRVRVLDGAGAPVAGVPLVSAAGAASLGTSGAGGWLEAQTTAEAVTLVVGDERWVTVHAGEWRANTTYDPVVVIAPAIRLAGRVENERGEGLRAARVRYALPEDFRTRFADILDAASDRSWLANTDPHGAFDFDGVPAIEGAELRAVLVGYEADIQPAPLQSAEGLTLILARPETPLAGSLRGRVVDPGGQPVEGARVSLGVESVVTREDGDFEIELFYAVTSQELIAVKQGFLPVRMERPGTPGEGFSGWPDFVVLQLPAPALAIRGRILDHENQPVADAKVWLADPTPVGPVGQLPMLAESLMAGAPIPPMALESRSRRPAADGDNFNDFYSSAGPPSALWYWVATDGAGNFELEGLDERHYRLNVMAANGLEIQTTDPIRAGADGLVITLPQPDQYDKVGGVVRMPDGRPVRGASVRLWRPVFDSTSRVFGGTTQVVLTESGGTVTTDEEGQFSFEDVPREGASLSVRGDDVVPTTFDLADQERPRSLELVVDVRCHLQVIVRDPAREPYDAIAVADDEDRPLDVLVVMEGSVNAYTDAPLVAGRSGVLSVSSRATQLLLLRGGEVVETVRIDLVPGEVNTIEP